MCNYYDDDDYEVSGSNTYNDDAEFFGNIELEEEFDLMMESQDALFDEVMMKLEGALVLAREEGDTGLADRMQDEIDLMLMTDYDVEEGE